MNSDIRALGVSALLTVLVLAAHVPDARTGAQRVTIAARPTLAPPFSPILVFGAVAPARERRSVTLQARDCGQREFRGVLAVESEPSGAWSTEFYPGINTTVRAVVGDDTSSALALRAQPRIFLKQLRAGGFEVAISAKVPLWRKRVLFQQRRSGSWRTLRSVVLTEQATPGVGSPIIWTSAKFTASIRRGSLVRALLPLSQARPCYAAGVSNTWRRT